MSLPKIILAIDPGQSGAIAWQVEHGKSGACNMPRTPEAIVEFLQKLRGRFEFSGAVLEQLIKHMGLGTPASTMAVYASNWGVILGALLMDGWKVEIVTPQAWQKALDLGITGRQKANTKGMTSQQAKAEKTRVRLLNGELKRAWKNRLKDRAQQLYPHLDVTLHNADALLMLSWYNETKGVK